MARLPPLPEELIPEFSTRIDHMATLCRTRPKSFLFAAGMRNAGITASVQPWTRAPVEEVKGSCPPRPVVQPDLAELENGR
jgi:hypothetical protein